MTPISVEELYTQLSRHVAANTDDVLSVTNITRAGSEFYLSGNPITMWIEDSQLTYTHPILLREGNEGETMTTPVLVTLQEYQTLRSLLFHPYQPPAPMRDWSTSERKRRTSPWLQQLTRMAWARLKTLRYEYENEDQKKEHVALELFLNSKTDFSRILGRLPTSLRLHREYVVRSAYLSLDNFVPAGDTEEYLLVKQNSYQCGSCGEWHPNGTHAYVHANSAHWRNSTMWCESCTSHETFYCDITGNNYSSDEFNRGETVHGDSICEEAASSMGWWYDEDADGWRDEDERVQVVPEYHEAERPDFVPPNRLQAPEDRTYGIELEVEFSEEGDREEFFTTFFKPSGLSNEGEFSAEMDGSLNDDLGLEVISAPFRLAAYQAPPSDHGWHRMCKRLFEAGARGWPVRKGYGMHVNVDIRPIGMSLMEAESDEGYKLIHKRASRFISFLLNNKDLTARLAGRVTPYGGEQMKKVRNQEDATEMMNQGKYVPAILRGGFVLEVRIFGANVRYEGLLRNVEYVDSGLAYIDEASAQLFHSLTTSSYRAWLLKPENAARWPAMAAYLAAKVTPENVDIKRAAA